METLLRQAQWANGRKIQNEYAWGVQKDAMPGQIAKAVRI